jgi:hypothetical protein
MPPCYWYRRSLTRVALSFWAVTILSFARAYESLSVGSAAICMSTLEISPCEPEFADRSKFGIGMVVP